MKNSILMIMLITVFWMSLANLHSENELLDNSQFSPITLTNHVEYNDSKFNNAIDGCGFLLKTKKANLAVTCKHALWVAKSDVMKYISFEGTLKEWRMQRKDDTLKYVITEKLINENKEEEIGEANVQKDYLIFSIKENKSDVKPLLIRETPLVEGEDVFLVGWSFGDKTGAQRIHKMKYYKEIGNKILLEMNETKNLAGMSGAPVVDKDGLLVGIVSDFYFEDATQKWFYSPCSTKYLKEMLGKYGY